MSSIVIADICCIRPCTGSSAPLLFPARAAGKAQSPEGRRYILIGGGVIPLSPILMFKNDFKFLVVLRIYIIYDHAQAHVLFPARRAGSAMS